MTYEEIKCFLPKNIITSVFSLHGEYPIERTRNYLGHNILEIYDISKIYGKNHFNLKSISGGIARFVSLFQKKKVNNLLEVLNLKFSEKIKIHLNYKHYDGGYDNLDMWANLIIFLGYEAWISFVEILNPNIDKDLSNKLWKYATTEVDDLVNDNFYENMELLGETFIINVNDLFTIQNVFQIDIISYLMKNPVIYFNDIYFI